MCLLRAPRPATLQLAIVAVAFAELLIRGYSRDVAREDVAARLEQTKSRASSPKER
jgi:hypothetical protein